MFVPVVLENVASMISGYNLNIYHIEICFRRDNKYGLFITVDFTNSEVSPEKLSEEFKNNEYVEDAIMSSKFKNVIYSSRFYPMVLGVLELF